MKSTLILNKDWVPISIMPISALDWHRAIYAVYLNKVEVIHNYDNWNIRSPTQSMVVPAVVVYRRPYVKINTRFVSQRSSNAFLRDNFTCQYCGSVEKAQNLTVDHVLPRSKGGSSKLNNLSASCYSCNNQKGNDETILPRNMPHQPSYYELMSKTRQRSITVPHLSWIQYLAWNPDCISVSEPIGMPGYTPLSADIY